MDKNKKIVVSTICETNWIERSGLNKMINSFKYFHPDIPIIVHNEDDLKKIYDENPGVCLFSSMAFTMKEAKERSGADFVLHLDADSLVLSNLEDLFDEEHEIFSVRNDPTEHFSPGRNESQNRPHLIKNISNSLYLNAGFVGTSSDRFIDEWIDYNKYLISKYGSILKAGQECPIVEQGSLNLIAYYNNKYKLKPLDPENGEFYCGPSANFNNGNNHNPPEIIEDYGANHWDSWYSIYEKNGICYLNDRIVRNLHFCHGGKRKLNFDVFNSEFRKYLKKITGFDK